MNRKIQRLTKYLLDNEFFFLFASLCAFIFIPSLLSSTNDTTILNKTLLFIVILSSVYAVFNTKKHLYIGLFLGLAALILNATTLFFRYSETYNTFFTSAYLIQLGVFYVFFIYTTFHILKRVLKARRVSVNVIFGSVAGYLLIGLLGAISCMWYYMNNNTCFKGVSTHENTLSDFVYFSFVTLTSLGYGDITPSTQQTKTLAILLSFIGQFYLTILVAFLIGKFSQKEN